MPDEICPKDRALIDQAVRLGKVQKVPSGVSAEPLPVWDANMKRLTTPDGPAFTAWVKNKPRGKAKDPAVAKRRQRVVALSEQNFTSREAAKHLGVAYHVVLNDARIMGVSFIHPYDKKKAT